MDAGSAWATGSRVSAHFPGWIEVALFWKEITPQRLQLLDKFQEILRMEELLNLPPVRMYWTWAKRKKLEQQPPTMTIAANGGRKSSY